MRTLSYLTIIPLVTLFGCGTSWTAFLDNQNRATCQVLVNCFDEYETVNACVDAFEDPEGERCDDYRPRSAQECLNQLRQQSKDCPTENIDEWLVPAACAVVCADS